ncbi:cell wall integrity stress response component 1 [Fusarium circinatum]|uniref:Cell wall integrity stress response component 1 n=1 Tax=Fusarium circinatum TaxID=48490 RepID=A0A8H5UDH1_FUSCI|nr:cell wall integrity stress response component 1 [Fusarium circinatum]
MKMSGLLAMAIAGTSFVMAAELQQPAQTPVLNQQTRQGCFKSVGNMTQAFSGTDTSSGYCFNLCKKKYNAFALQGSKCYCGMLYPPEDDLVDDDKCNWPCPGYGKEACGALKTYYSVFNTGLELAPDNYKPEESSTTAAPSSTKAAESTAAEESAAPTGSQDAATTSEAPSEEKKKSGPNVAAIAAGVVVGVVVVAAIGGGAIFFVRRRRNAEIEEEHRRNAAVNAFINGSKPPGSSGSISMTDSRLDPVMAHRRLSDGSIADNQDYSRRILRVTNA